MKTFDLGLLATVIVASSAFAGEEVVSKDYKEPAPPTTCFKDQELQLDFFGSFMNQPYGHFDYRDGGGGGVGVNYFFIRYVGVGQDIDVDANRDGVSNYTGKVIFRLPIEAGGVCIAPYFFGGGGVESFFGDRYEHFHSQSNGALMAGGGLEWRITPRFGIFAEGRYTWTVPRTVEDNDRVRLGLRVAF